jgi:hypothetical protein
MESGGEARAAAAIRAGASDLLAASDRANADSCSSSKQALLDEQSSRLSAKKLPVMDEKFPVNSARETRRTWGSWPGRAFVAALDPGLFWLS